MPNNIFYTKTFNCLVRDRETILYQGNALAITTRNERGKLDVLPEHANFISIIDEFVDIIRDDNKILKIPVTRGILKIYDNEARIYLGIFSVSSQRDKKVASTIATTAEKRAPLIGTQPVNPTVAPPVATETTASSTQPTQNQKA